MAIDFKDLFNELKSEIITIAKNEFKELAAEAASDGTSLLHTIEENLKKYTELLANGQISKNDFKLLLLGNKDLVEMTALTQAGLLKAKADAFRTTVFDTILETVFKLI